MPDYQAMKKELPKLKGQLTRAHGDPEKVLQACEAAFEAFDRFGWPDNWHTWKIALSDAWFALRRSDAWYDDPDKTAELSHRFAVLDDEYTLYLGIAS